jgi:hypothetical protein
MKLRSIGKARLGSSLALAVIGALAGRPSSAAPPSDGSFSFSLPAGAVCSSGIELSGTGKTKTIDLPEGGFIMTSPGLHVTITNTDDPSKQTTTSITGSFHQSIDADGNVETVSTGRSLLFDPVAGLVIAVGGFSFVFDAAGNLIQPLAGDGMLTDVCEMVD